MKILHLGAAGGIMISFVEFNNKNFTSYDHQFLLDAEEGYTPPRASNVTDLSRYPRWLPLWPQIREMNHADKIILHGLFNLRIIVLLLWQPWILKRCYWVIWGGDLYASQLGPKTSKWYLKEFCKKLFVSKIGHLITHIKGDYELAKQWYGARGIWHSCFMYPSNLYKDHCVSSESRVEISILLGNSAAPTNHHMDVLEQLIPYANEDVRIYCPLSYGGFANADKIEQEGKKIFGEKFIALRHLMPIKEYVELLSKVDIALFNHDRQQAVGNITSLLGLGKKVYLRKGVTTWKMLTNMGIVVYDISKIELTKISKDVANRNIKIIQNNFTEKKLKEQWSKIYE